jgi:uncharacterized protein YacL
MNMRDFTLLFVAVLLILVFIVFQFDYYLKSEEMKLIQQNIKYDSIILQEQSELKKKDSIIIKDEQLIKGKLNNHEKRIKRIEDSF